MNDHGDVRRTLEALVDRVPEGRPAPRAAISRRVRRRQVGLAGALAVVVIAVVAGVVSVDARLRGDTIVRFTDQQAEPSTTQNAESASDAGSTAQGDTLRGYLPDGTPYLVRGPEAAEREPVGVGVTLLVEQADGPDVLGIVSSTRWRTDQLEGPLRRRPARWDGNDLVIVEPPWQLDIDIYDEQLSSQRRERLASAITTRVRRDHLVVSVDRPLRFAREADDFTAALSVEYDDGTAVTNGCPSQPPSRVLCSADGRLSLTLDPSLATSEWSISSR